MAGCFDGSFLRLRRAMDEARDILDKIKISDLTSEALSSFDDVAFSANRLAETARAVIEEAEFEKEKS